MKIPVAPVLRLRLKWPVIRAMGPLTAAIVMMGIAHSFIFPLLPLFAMQEAGMSAERLGWFMTILGIANVAVGTIIGKLSDNKWSRKGVIIGSLAAGALGYFLFVFIRDYALLVGISVVFFGISSASFPQLFAYAKEQLEQDSREKLTFRMNLLRMCFSIAWVIGPPLGTLFISLQGFHLLFLAAAAMNVAAIGIVLFSFKRTEHHIERNSLELQEKPPYRKVAVSTVSFVLLGLASQASFIALPLLVVRHLHGTNGQAGMLFSVAAGAEIVLLAVCGYLSMRFAKLPLLIVGAAVNVLYYAGLYFADSIWQLILLQLLSALGVSIIMGIGMSYFQDLLPDAPGTATTLYTNTSKVGSIMGGAIAGTVGGALGFPAVFIVCAAFAVCAAGLLIVQYATASSGRSRPAPHAEYREEQI